VRPPFSCDNKAHGRITHHELRIVPVEAETLGLPFARAVLSVTRTAQSTQEGDEPTTGQRFFVTSLEPTDRRPATFAEIVRSHWGIENKTIGDAMRNGVRTRRALKTRRPPRPWPSCAGPSWRSAESHAQRSSPAIAATPAPPSA
jgi:hypothetical protein